MVFRACSFGWLGNRTSTLVSGFSGLSVGPVVVGRAMFPQAFGPLVNQSTHCPVGCLFGRTADWLTACWAVDWSIGPSVGRSGARRARRSVSRSACQASSPQRSGPDRPSICSYRLSRATSGERKEDWQCKQ